MGQGDDAVGDEEEEFNKLEDEQNGQNADDVVGESELAWEITNERGEKDNNPFQDEFRSHDFILHRTGNLSIGQQTDQRKGSNV